MKKILKIIGYIVSLILIISSSFFLINGIAVGYELNLETAFYLVLVFWSGLFLFIGITIILIIRWHDKKQSKMIKLRKKDKIQ